MGRTTSAVARMPQRVYVASSWRNTDQPKAVRRLRAAGFEVYDFRHPASGGPRKDVAPLQGFSWADVAGRDWKETPPKQFCFALAHPLSAEAFDNDRAALEWADICLLLLPCGRSAHLEAGFAAGQGKRLWIVLDPTYEPELMYGFAERIAASLDDLLEWAVRVHAADRPRLPAVCGRKEDDQVSKIREQSLADIYAHRARELLFQARSMLDRCPFAGSHMRLDGDIGPLLWVVHPGMLRLLQAHPPRQDDPFPLLEAMAGGDCQTWARTPWQDDPFPPVGSTERTMWGVPYEVQPEATRTIQLVIALAGGATATLRPQEEDQLPWE